MPGIEASQRRCCAVAAVTLSSGFAPLLFPSPSPPQLTPPRSLKPFHAQQYTPAGLRQEEHAVSRKLKWIVATKLIEVAELMAYSSFVDNPDKLLPVATAMRCAAIVMVNATFTTTLLDRPYVSFRRSKRIGDPSNDAELLTTRVLSWGSAALAFKVALTAETDSIHAKWVMDVICAGVVVGLLVSQRPLLQGAVEVIRDAALSRSSSFGGFGRSDPAELSVDKKSKRHSGVTDASSGSEIAAMMESDSFREILYHQSMISVRSMEEAEKLRWAPEVDAEGDLVQKKGWLRGKIDTTRLGRWWKKGQALLSVFAQKSKKHNAAAKAFVWLFAMVGYLMAIALFLFLVGRGILLGADNTVLRWQITLLPTAMCAWQERVIWRRRKEDKGRAGAEDIEAGVEMQTANTPPPPPKAAAEFEMNPIQECANEEGRIT